MTRKGKPGRALASGPYRFVIARLLQIVIQRLAASALYKFVVQILEAAHERSRPA
jgi:hypothetical protein